MKSEKLNLTELDAQELRRVEGGVAPLVWAAWAVMVAVDAALITAYATYDSAGKLKHK
jgi:class IIb bacteriocin, lactobin A/cerein 7B family